MLKEPKFAGTATIGAKGQIVIPHEARELVDLKPGDKVVILADENHNGFLAVKPEIFDKILARMNERFSVIEKIRENAKKSK